MCLVYAVPVPFTITPHLCCWLPTSCVTHQAGYPMLICKEYDSMEDSALNPKSLCVVCWADRISVLQQLRPITLTGEQEVTNTYSGVNMLKIALLFLKLSASSVLCLFSLQYLE